MQRRLTGACTRSLSAKLPSSKEGRCNVVAVPNYLQPDHRSQPKVTPPADFRLATTLEGLQQQANALVTEITHINDSLVGQIDLKAKTARRHQLESAQQVVWDAIRKEKARLRHQPQRLNLRLAYGLPIDEASA